MVNSSLVCDLCTDTGSQHDIHTAVKNGKCIDKFCDNCHKYTWHCEWSPNLVDAVNLNKRANENLNNLLNNLWGKWKQDDKE